MLASARATPMTIRGTLIDSTIFHTSDQLMESIVDVLFQFRNPASQSQISSLSIPVCVSIDMGRRRPEGGWEPLPPIQLHGQSPYVGPRVFCRIARTICREASGPRAFTLPTFSLQSLAATPAHWITWRSPVISTKTRSTVRRSASPKVICMMKTPPPAPPPTGSWTLPLAALTPQCTAKPYRWRHGQAAHTATRRVNGLFRVECGWRHLGLLR